MNNLEFTLEMKNKRLASGLSQGELLRKSITVLSHTNIAMTLGLLIINIVNY